MKKIISVALCAIMLVSLCGCAALSDLFVGIADSQWKLVSMTDNGVELDEAYLDQEGVTGTITFDKETFSMNLQGNSFGGTYVLSGGQLTLTIGEETIEATCADDIITMHIDGASLFFAKQ